MLEGETLFEAMGGCQGRETPEQPAGGGYLDLALAEQHLQPDLLGFESLELEGGDGCYYSVR